MVGENRRTGFDMTVDRFDRHKLSCFCETESVLAADVIAAHYTLNEEDQAGALGP